MGEGWDGGRRNLGVHLYLSLSEEEKAKKPHSVFFPAPKYGFPPHLGRFCRKAERWLLRSLSSLVLVRLLRLQDKR